MRLSRCLQLILIAAMSATMMAGLSFAEDPKKPEKKKPEFPAMEKVTKDYKKVEGDGGAFFELWTNKKTGQILSLIHISEPTRPY